MRAPPRACLPAVAAETCFAAKTSDFSRGAPKESDFGHRAEPAAGAASPESVAASSTAGAYYQNRRLQRAELKAELAKIDRELLREGLAAQQEGRAQGLTPAASLYNAPPAQAPGVAGLGAYGSGAYFAQRR